MADKKLIAAVIPAYKVVTQIQGVINTMPDMIDHIFVVDDKCPDKSGKVALEISKTNSKVHVLFNKENAGVGGTVMTGYAEALKYQCDIVVKVDGDGQMNPEYIPDLIAPLLKNTADYTKGNRFHNVRLLKNMPHIRLFGNSILSFVIKVCSGYWNIMDPTNGYTAISFRALNKLNFTRISKRYFFESDMLIHLNIHNCVVKDIPMPVIYGDEESSLRIGNILIRFPGLLIKRFFKRILYKYFIYDFNMASVYLLVGVPMFLFGSFFGIYRWIYGIVQQEINTTGTIMLSVMPIILGVQFILQAIQIDINSIPRKNRDDE